MSRATYQCKICNERFTGGSREVPLDIINHGRERHSKEFNEAYADRTAYEVELNSHEERLRKDYPNWQGGFDILFEEITKSAKRWICTDCKKEFGYGQKYFHETNAYRYCKKDFVQKQEKP